MEEKIYYAIGLMSGSSLDGLDVSYCRIAVADAYHYTILHCESYPFSAVEKATLKNIPTDIFKNYDAESILFGQYCAEKINAFIKKYAITYVDCIASHGHTIYHYPEKGKTLQIGDGKIMAQLTKHLVINNFRQKDIDAGGQGAPLVPLCDAYFFSDYDACLNIGGIANISFDDHGERTGFDICAANQLLNYLANTLQLDFDRDGALAAKGHVHQDMLTVLNSNAYFYAVPPKSMDNGWIHENLIPVFKKADISAEDKLATATEHIAYQISRIISQHAEAKALAGKSCRVLVSGGGAFNAFLIARIRRLSNAEIIIPDNKLIQFKETLAMCLMGILRRENKPNFLPSVTGAANAVCGGEIYEPE